MKGRTIAWSESLKHKMNITDLAHRHTRFDTALIVLTPDFSDAWFQRAFMYIASQYPMKVLYTHWCIGMCLALQSTFQGILYLSAYANSSQKVQADMQFTDV